MKPKDPLVWLNPPLITSYVLIPKYILDPTSYGHSYSPSETPEGRLQHFLFLTSFFDRLLTASSTDNNRGGPWGFPFPFYLTPLS
ncbi:uncharacterized protein N7525_009180 [Penicillium rubens]|uniref:uncharacterized protein n=1 Tax=Penicillium rubens TaxID=1108849 RepID=UPI002A5AA62C|nr:uncharacterized protein N7525_009180 [Penicillium rubens]KAJ5830927.1 hypothetical protein N7525_009180 [Penicillium rubens]KAJ5854475.1 hypothetical protein N7534_007018 [Penicillium rubens]